MRELMMEQVVLRIKMPTARGAHILVKDMLPVTLGVRVPDCTVAFGAALAHSLATRLSAMVKHFITGAAVEIALLPRTLPVVVGIGNMLFMCVEGVEISAAAPA